MYVGVGALSTRDAEGNCLPLGHLDWVLGVDQLLLQGIEGDRATHTCAEELFTLARVHNNF